MAVFTIGDLHLSTNSRTDKSMEAFGGGWRGYTGKIERNWRAAVVPSDTVVVPGDISWAMNLEEALPDFRFLDALPGLKILGKGNHDFFWTTVTKMTRFLEERGVRSVRFLYNGACEAEDRILCGTRGWFLEERQQVTAGNADYGRILARETLRLRASLKAAEALREKAAAEGRSPAVTAFLHFPPVWQDFVCRPIVDVLHEYGDPDCYFGHIHGTSDPGPLEFEGLRLRLVSADALRFAPYRLPPAAPGAAGPGRRADVENLQNAVDNPRFPL